MMTKNTLTYKGYQANIELDVESMTLRGKIEGINDYVDFESDSIATIEDEFRSAVDDYIAFCEEVGKTPEKEYKGNFNVRVSPALHRKAVMRAHREGRSLNSVVEYAISCYVES